MSWMQRLKHVFHIDIEHCGVCGATLRVIIADEPDETFTLTLSSPSNVTLGDATATGTIRDTTTAPTIVQAAVTSTPLLTSSGGSTPDTYGAGEDIEFTVTFSAAVEVTGDPQFGFSLAGARVADYDSGSGSERLTFVYTVQPTDQDDDGIWVGNHASGNPTLQLDADDAITSLGGTAANLEHDTLDRLDDHKVDGSRTADEPVEPVEPVEVTLHLSDADGEVAEDAGAVTVTATVSPASATAFTVTVSASPVAPATDDDFELSTNRALRFAANANASAGTVTIAPVDDGDVEPNQVVTVSGSASIEGVTGPDDVTLTILDDDLARGGISARTPRVRDRILELLKYRHSFKGDSSGVNETHLAKLQSLDLGRNPSTESAFTMSLRSNDFEGLVNLERLYLRETGLRSLPAEVFSGLAALETLELDNNQLRSLPAGVFSGLNSLKTLELHRNQLNSLPYDEFEALPNLTNLRIDQVGRHKLQVAGGEGEVTLEVAAGGSETYPVRLMAAPDSRITADNPLTIEVSSDTAGVVATPAALQFTKENWFRRQTVTVGVVSSTSGTAELVHDASGTTTDSEGNEQSNYDFEAYPLPTVTVRVLESDAGRSDDPLTAAFEGLPEAHDGETAFSFRLAFSEAVAVTPEAMRTRVLTVAGGAVTGAARVDGESGVWEITVTPDSREELSIALAPAANCEADGAVCTLDGRALSVVAAHIVLGPGSETEPTLTASFEGLPGAHDGEEAFHFRVAFSEEIGIGFRSMRDDSFTVDGGEVTKARRVEGRHDLWRITVEPGGEGDVTVTLPAGRECAVSGAICTRGGDRRQLTNTPTATVAGPAPVVVPLTASFVEAPAEHDGETAFKLRIAFSEDISIGFRTFRDRSLSVSGGSVKHAKRVDRRKDLWEVTVKPDSLGDVTVTLEGGRACGTAGAVCTGDGRALSATISTTVLGPAALSVADARVREAEDALLVFEVTLDRARHAAVTVDYVTSDVTARAGEDYTSASGTLTFATGERLKTVEVTVFDDAHDEGEETLTLTLSNPSGAYLADATATGTIENSDHMPKAWMVRFGRTVGSQVVDALNARLDGAGGSHVTVAGINLIGAPGLEPQAEDDDPFGHPEWAKNAEREADARTITAEDIRLRSAFHLSSGGDGTHEGGPTFTAWGRVVTGGFRAEEDGGTMDGDVTNGLVGFDAEWERALAGIMLSQSSGDGSYRLDPAKGDDAGTVESSLTGVYPYAQVDLNRQVSAWALAGIGSGELTLHQEGKKPMPTDISMRMGAVGVKGQVLDGTGASGLAMNVKSDAMWVGTKSADTSELAPTEGDVTRLRLILQGERTFEAGNGATFTPSAEVGLRHDGGDAETGTGLEVGAGLRYTVGAVTIEAEARTLLAHEASGYKEWGMSGAIRVTPDASGRGLTLSIAPVWGRTGSAAERLWSARDARALGGDSEFEAGSRIALDAGYGFGLAHRRGVLTPYAGFTLGDAGNRTVRTGTRWQLGPDAVVALEGSRQASDAGEADNQLMLRVALRF